MEKTYKVDRTIVTVGAPRMLAMPTMPASLDALASTRFSSGYSTTAAGEDFAFLLQPTPASSRRRSLVVLPLARLLQQLEAG
jgi:hypothetical protein